MECNGSRFSVRIASLGNIATGSFGDGYSMNADRPSVIQARYSREFVAPFMDNAVRVGIIETKLVLYGARD